MKRYRKTRTRCEEAIRHTAYRLGVSPWLKIAVKFDESHSDDRVVCQTTADWEYRQASFLWNLMEAATMSDHDLRGIAVCTSWCTPSTTPSGAACPTSSKTSSKSRDELATENLARVIEYLLEELDERKIQTQAS